VIQSASSAQTTEPRAYDATQVLKTEGTQTFEKTVVSKPPVADTDSQ
jgi:hypothetical protein